MFAPSIKILPSVGSYIRSSNCATVDFPLPDSPTNPIFSPLFTLSEKSYRTVLSLEGYLKLTFLNSISPLISLLLIPPVLREASSSSSV